MKFEGNIFKDSDLWGQRRKQFGLANLEVHFLLKIRIGTESTVVLQPQKHTNVRTKFNWTTINTNQLDGIFI